MTLCTRSSGGWQGQSLTPSSSPTFSSIALSSGVLDLVKGFQLTWQDGATPGSVINATHPTLPDRSIFVKPKGDGAVCLNRGSGTGGVEFYNGGSTKYASVIPDPSDVSKCVASFTGKGAFTGVFSALNLSPGYETTVTSAGTKTLTAASAQQQFFTGINNHTAVLPNTANLTIGQPYEFFNDSTGTVSVLASDSSVVQVVPSGKSFKAVVTSTATSTNTSWSGKICGFKSLLQSDVLGLRNSDSPIFASVSTSGNISVGGNAVVAFNVSADSVTAIGTVGCGYLANSGFNSGANAIIVNGSAVGGVAAQQWLNFRRGGSPAGACGVILSNFSNSHYFLHNNGGALTLAYSTEGTDVPTINSATSIVTIGTGGAIQSSGTIRSSAPGQLLHIDTYNVGGLAISVNSTTATTINSTTYNPKSSSSYILIYYNTTYYSSGTNGDDWFTNINVNGVDLAQFGYQLWNNANGGGTRSGILLPIEGLYQNSSLSALTILITARRNSSDDTFTFNRVGSLFKIIEIAR